MQRVSGEPRDLRESLELSMVQIGLETRIDAVVGGRSTEPSARPRARTSSASQPPATRRLRAKKKKRGVSGAARAWKSVGRVLSKARAHAMMKLSLSLLERVGIGAGWLLRRRGRGRARGGDGRGGGLPSRVVERRRRVRGASLRRCSAARRGTMAGSRPRPLLRKKFRTPRMGSRLEKSQSLRSRALYFSARPRITRWWSTRWWRGHDVPLRWSGGATRPTPRCCARRARLCSPRSLYFCSAFSLNFESVV